MGGEEQEGAREHHGGLGESGIWDGGEGGREEGGPREMPRGV